MAAREMTLPPLGARLRDAGRRMGLPAFWNWWSRELDAIVPAAPRAALERRRMRPVLVFAADHVTPWQPATVEGRPAMVAGAPVALTGDAAQVNAAGSALLAALAAKGQPGASRVVVSLAPRDVLRKKIVLPAAVEENFRQALAYDLDRHTPFKADELYFDAAVVDRTPARGTITVDLAAARRAAVDPALRHVAAWGGDVVAVVPEPPATAAVSRLNLLPPELRRSRSVWRRWQFWVPLGVLAALVLAAVAIPLWQKRDYVMQLATLADEARKRAAVSETLRAELNARVADYNFALERKYAFPSALLVVDTVSKLMPDDTWLTQFDLKSTSKGKEIQREILVRGETLNAGRLVQLMEESQLFAQSGQRGPTTKIQPGPGEIFDLGAQLKPRPAPPQLALAVADTPADAAAPSAPGTPAPAAAPAPPPAMPGASGSPAPSAPAAATPAPVGATPPPSVAMPPPTAATPPGAAPKGGSAMNAPPAPATPSAQTPPAAKAPTAAPSPAAAPATQSDMGRKP
jgi:general secretion pathway protein L